MRMLVPLAVVFAPMPIAAADPATQSEVAVTITDLRSAKGVIRACMTTNPAIFPRCREDPASYRLVVPAGDKVQLVFRGVKPGRYAIALLHDENNNGKADRAMGMMPKEGFGFSRDAPVKMAPPKFDAAAFDVTGTVKVLNIRMRYML